MQLASASKVSGSSEGGKVADALRQTCGLVAAAVTPQPCWATELSEAAGMQHAGVNPGPAPGQATGAVFERKSAAAPAGDWDAGRSPNCRGAAVKLCAGAAARFLCWTGLQVQRHSEEGEEGWQRR